MFDERKDKQDNNHKNAYPTAPYIQRSTSAPAIAEHVSEAIIPGLHGYDQSHDRNKNNNSNENETIADDHVASMLSLINDTSTRAPLDLIQADFPSTPSSIFSNRMLSTDGATEKASNNNEKKNTVELDGDSSNHSNKNFSSTLSATHIPSLTRSISDNVHNSNTDTALEQATNSLDALYVGVANNGDKSPGPNSLRHKQGSLSPIPNATNSGLVNLHNSSAANTGNGLSLLHPTSDNDTANSNGFFTRGVNNNKSGNAGFAETNNNNQQQTGFFDNSQQPYFDQNSQQMYYRQGMQFGQDNEGIIGNNANDLQQQMQQGAGFGMQFNAMNNFWANSNLTPEQQQQQQIQVAAAAAAATGLPISMFLNNPQMNINMAAAAAAAAAAVQQQQGSNPNNMFNPVTGQFMANNNANNRSLGGNNAGGNNANMGGLFNRNNVGLMGNMNGLNNTNEVDSMFSIRNDNNNLNTSPFLGGMDGNGLLGRNNNNMNNNRGMNNMAGLNAMNGMNMMGAMGMGGMGMDAAYLGGGMQNGMRRDRRDDHYRDNREHSRRDRNDYRDRRDRDNRDRGGNGVNPTRDPLVEDFRNSYGKSRQWELRDLLGHTVSFCQDQHGSRFIQQRLEVCSDVDKQLVFDEIVPSAQTLMIDVFGNYVLQKLFEYGTPEQCESLALLLKGQAVQLAMQMYGCRVVQKALEYVNTNRLIEIITEFEEPSDLLRCVHDSNGNHVIQKCIEVINKASKEAATPEASDFLASKIQFIINTFQGKVKELSSHPYGCRVIQRILEYCNNSQKSVILDELRKCCKELVQDCYGNYVIQFVMQHGWEADRAALIKEVQSNLLDFSQHKFASNVVEKCLQFASKKDRDEMIWTIINVTFDLKNPVDAKGHCVLESMVRDPYANYVVQKVIDVSDDRQRAAIMRYVKENITQLRRYTYGKHIIVRLEKITNEKF